MTVTKKIIAHSISKNLGISDDDAKSILNKFYKLILLKSDEGASVKIAKFGFFKLKRTKKRLGRNPLSKKEYIIKPTNKLFFSPSKKIKVTFN